MWIYSVLPEWAFHTLLILGLVATITGFALGTMPFIKKYALAIKISGVFALFLAIYLEGGLSDYREWEFKSAELKVKLAEMETKLAQADTKVVEKVVTKTQVIKEKGKEVIKYVDREVVKYDTKFLPGGQCELPQEFFKAYNDSLGKDIK
jgi:hypothetical protein